MGFADLAAEGATQVTFDNSPPTTGTIAGPRVRRIDPNSSAELALVAERMRETLCEVLGAEEGREMYSVEWLEQRLRWHLDSEQSTGAVFLSEGAEGEITGHTIVRVERDGSGSEFGLFSTTFVEPDARRQSIASALLSRGEHWMREQGMSEAVTYTARDNSKLITLFEGRGYSCVMAPRKDMVILSRALNSADRAE